MNKEIFYKGKVRDLYKVDNKSMIMFTSDRISVFDVVLNNTIPNKGIILNQISIAWQKYFEKINFYNTHGISCQLIESDFKKFPSPYKNNIFFKDRSVYVKKGERINFECIVRKYLTGSAWNEYKKSIEDKNYKSLMFENINLKNDLCKGAKLENAIFTPSTKEEIGDHDINISFTEMKKKLGDELSEKLKKVSLEIFNIASEKLEKNGILLADTKFEFAILNNEILLIDEILTPDSSRYWKKEDYLLDRENGNEIPQGLDKQFIRNYVESLNWNKSPPPPPLPQDVIKKTCDLYDEIYKIILEVT